MTPSENYYSNHMVDKIYEIQSNGDTRSFEAIERDLWHEKVDKDFKDIDSLTAQLKHIATIEQCIELVSEQLEDVEGSRDIDESSIDMARKGIAETLEYIKGIST